MSFLQMLLYTGDYHKTCSMDTHTHRKQKLYYLLILVLLIQSMGSWFKSEQKVGTHAGDSVHVFKKETNYKF